MRFARSRLDSAGSLMSVDKSKERRRRGLRDRDGEGVLGGGGAIVARVRRASWAETFGSDTRHRPA